MYNVYIYNFWNIDDFYLEDIIEIEKPCHFNTLKSSISIYLLIIYFMTIYDYGYTKNTL